MRIVTLSLILLITFLSNAQREEFEKKFWGETQLSYDQSIPDNWLGESAVILLKEDNDTYEEPGSLIRHTKSIHKIIKLLDQAALEEFSTFVYRKSYQRRDGYININGEQFLGIKIIKPNGNEKVIVADESSVKVDDEFKLAVSGLEKGDIIDYFLVTKEEFRTRMGYLFDRERKVLREKYPCLKYKFDLKFTVDFRLNIASFNGAPEIKEQEVEKKKWSLYALEADHIEKAEYPIWFYPELELPFFKFQISYAFYPEDKKEFLSNFLPKSRDSIKTSVTQTDVYNYYSEENRFYKLNSERYLKKYSKDNSELDKIELVRNAYYYCRYRFLTRYIQPSIFEKYIPDIKNNPYIYYAMDPIIYRKDIDFLEDFSRFLVYNEIPFDLVIAYPKRYGGINSLLSVNEVVPLLKIKNDKTNENIYISGLDKFLTFNTLPYSVLGTKAYAFSYDYDEKKLSSDVKDLKLPTSSASENFAKEHMEINFSEDFSNLEINIKNEFSGYLKVSQQFQVLSVIDYVDEDTDEQKEKDIFSRMRSDNRREIARKKYDAYIKKLEEKENEFLLEFYNDNYDFKIEEQSTTMKNTGRLSKDSNVVYNSKLIVKDQLIKKAGDNFIFEIGKLNGNQIELEDSEKQREYNVYMNYPRSYVTSIKVNIPEGYQVIGLDNLNMKISNDQASFSSNSHISNNQLFVTTRKVYYQTDVNHNDWINILNVLDKALKFNDAKILFKKL